MNFVEVKHYYFCGERIEAFFYILATGLLLLVLAVTALASRRDGVGWSLAVPLLSFGLVAVGTRLTAASGQLAHKYLTAEPI